MKGCQHSQKALLYSLKLQVRGASHRVEQACTGSDYQASAHRYNSACVLQDVYAKVHEIMTGNLGAAGTTQGLNITPGSQGLLIVCASMRVLGVLEECCKDYANRFTHVLVKLINRVARDHASPGGFVLDSSRQAMGRSR